MLLKKTHLGIKAETFSQTHHFTFYTGGKAEGLKHN